jgi:hypothetical protein
MNPSGLKSFLTAHTFDQELLKELFDYGHYEADFETENEYGSFRVSVIRHDKTKKLYWVRQWNGEVTEFRNIA